MTEEAHQWNAEIASLPGAHILQTWEWGALKAITGWKPEPILWKDAGGRLEGAAMVLKRSVRLPGLATSFSVLYAPRGPLLDWSNVTLRDRALLALERYARDQKAIFVKIDPALPIGRGAPGRTETSDDAIGLQVQAELAQRGWVYSRDQIQFRNTVCIDLRDSEETWLARMKQKTRYNIRLAERKGVQVRQARRDEWPALYKMYTETGVRDGFVVRPEAYYLDAWRRLSDAGLAEVLAAEVEGDLVAGLVLYHFGETAWYFYGMSRDIHREKMPTYLLQWEAMRRARDAGCTVYDLWGAPEQFDENDAMWGVYRFKEGLGGDVVRTLGAWDYPARPWLYQVYTRVLPQLLKILRRRGKEQNRQEALG